MKKPLLLLFFYSFFVWSDIYAEMHHDKLLASKIHDSSNKNRKSATISFVFNNEDLVDIINMLAAKKAVNIILPTGANAINAKVSLAIPQKLTLQEAWDLLYTLLDIAGYSLVPKKDLYVIVKNSKAITSEPFPIFINTPVSEIPNTDERIRYMYYLKNIKISQEFDNQVTGLFKEFMPEDSLLKGDSDSNGLLVIGKSQDVKSFIEVLDALDEVGFHEALEPIRLRYTKATNVAKIFSEILKTAAPQPNIRHNLDKPDQAASYFSSNVRVIPEVRSNSLIVLGRSQAVERIKDFIFKHIDIELDSGKSILHIYELQYLDASDFAPVLRNIVESTRSGGTEQSKTSGAQGGIERFFDQVIIQPDVSGEGSEENAEAKYFGGNKLVVAARNDDWKRIKALIEQLDQPQPQVIIEVLLADLTLDDVRSLGSITRNPKDLAFPGDASIQTAMIDQVVLDAPSNDPDAINKLTGVASDLNAVTIPTPSGSPEPYVSVPQDQTPGSTVLSISDNNGNTWSILEILQLFNTTKILSHPHIIAINNQKASIEVGETRLLPDQAAPSTSGITIRKQPIEANTNVYITPRISSANTVNLLVEIKVDQFINPTEYTSGNRISRYIVTNATVKSGDILALGGLIREDTSDAITRTPILSDIPILGWFFKKKNKTVAQTSLSIFISPTIIQPKLRGGVGEYTKAYVEIAKNYSRQSGIFDNLRDPVTRWFFKTDSETEVITSDFLQKDESVDVLYKSNAVDLIANREAQLFDQQIANAPINTTSALKDFLVDEENPLENKKPVKVIEGAPRVKGQPTQTHNKNCTVNNSQHRAVNSTQDNQNNNAVTHNLKSLLADQENPLSLNKNPIVIP